MKLMIYPDQIYKLSEKLHWMKIAEDGVLEFYLDNQMLQTFRMCEARFFEEYVEGYKPRGDYGRVWFLDFGTCVHDAIEYFYIQRKTNNPFDLINFIGDFAKEIWLKRDMEYWKDKEVGKGKKSYSPYKELGGQLGFSGLLLQYATYFAKENERMRVIGTELYFGKNKEVPLYDQIYFEDPFRLYLTGKIDLLVDDGHSIGPMDHKTSRDFMGKNPSKMYEIQDGMTGYVFAAKAILRNFWDKEYLDKIAGREGVIKPIRQVNKIWMNFLQVRATQNLEDRFKRIPLYKTDTQLEEYRQRQISTAARIYHLLENYQPDKKSTLLPVYNTMACTNWMHHDCIFQEVHRQDSKESQLLVLNADFVKDQSKIWNPENLQNGEIAENETNLS